MSSTPYTCIGCGSPVEQDTVTVTTCDHEGNPSERESTGYYCTNKSCIGNTVELEPEDMVTEVEPAPAIPF